MQVRASERHLVMGVRWMRGDDQLHWPPHTGCRAADNQSSCCCDATLSAAYSQHDSSGGV